MHMKPDNTEDIESSYNWIISIQDSVIRSVRVGHSSQNLEYPRIF